MHYSLIVIGANDGAVIDRLVRDQARQGRVLLVEPVPFLYEKMRRRLGDVPNVQTVPCVVSTKDGPVEFHAPRPSASALAPHADKLGSVVAGHAAVHAPVFAEHTEQLTLTAVTPATLIKEFDITSVGLLFTDTEGHDADILMAWPFHQVLPKQLFFEFKHCDGTFRVGRRLGQLLIALDVIGYDVQVADVENMSATHRAPARR